MKSNEAAEIDRGYRRARLRFSMILSGAVLTISFFTGVVLGLRRDLQPVFAAAPDDRMPAAFIRTHLPLPGGLSLSRVGEDAAVNGRETEIFSFTSARAVKDILTEQVQIWESRGLKTYGMGTASRGMAVALDTQTGSRFSLSAWRAPMEAAAGEPQTAGFAAVLSGGSPQARAAERSGRIEGIPPMPRGEAGALMRSKEDGETVYTAAYTNPGKLEQSLDFYERLLAGSGWTKSNTGNSRDNRRRTGSLAFEAPGRETALFFTETKASGELRTTATVVLRSKR